MKPRETVQVFDLGAIDNWLPEVTQADHTAEIEEIGPCVRRLLHNYAVQYLRALSAGLSGELLFATAIMGGGRTIERAARPHEVSTDAYTQSADLFVQYIRSGGSAERLLQTIDEQPGDEWPYEILPPQERRID